MPGAKQLVGTSKMGYKVVCFSGGFRLGTGPAKEKLGLDAIFQMFTWKRWKINRSNWRYDVWIFKRWYASKNSRLMGITRADTLVCGDGANDLSMFAHADTRVAFVQRSS